MKAYRDVEFLERHPFFCLVVAPTMLVFGYILAGAYFIGVYPFGR